MFNIKVKQIAEANEFDEAVKNTENLVACAGRWGPMCIPVYGAMEQMETDSKFNEINFRVVNFDSEPAGKIRSLKECRRFMGLPFIVYYKNGEVVHATSGLQTRQQLEENIEKYLL
jgi:thioredoxin 1